MRIIQTMADGKNKKYLLGAGDHFVEMAYIYLDYRQEYRHILCISSQIGCRYGCRFCENRKVRLVRNLTMEELRFQVNTILTDQAIDSDYEVDFMGVGEPLENMENVYALIAADDRAAVMYGISTVVPPGRKLDPYLETMQGSKLRLQISLHSSVEAKRNRLIGQALRIQDCIRLAERFYPLYPYRRVAVNYCLIEGLNDSPPELEELIAFMQLLKGIAYVKISFPNSDCYRKSTRTQDWVDALHENGIACKLFSSSSARTGMGCGQLTTGWRSGR